MNAAQNLVVAWDGQQRSPQQAPALSVAGSPAAPVIELAGDTSPETYADTYSDPGRWSPERLFLASLSHCHMQTFLELCSSADIEVEKYVDRAVAHLSIDLDGGAWISDVVLKPRIVVGTPEQVPTAIALQRAAREQSLLARSVGFPVRIEPVLSAA